MTSLRQIPSVDSLLKLPEAQRLTEKYGREWTLSALRSVLQGLRAEPAPEIAIPGDQEILTRTQNELEKQALPSLRPVINASGVILHTNLGRAPLARAALQAAAEVSAGYSTLEFDLGGGKRGKRDFHADRLLRRLTGAEASLVVNNNAGALLLVLSALTKRKKVAISRSQLIEIGGGFRIPDVMSQSGSHLLEVGTTNRTHLTDYQTALEQGASAILLAHPSNFRLTGFTSQPDLPEVAALAHAFSVPLIFDLGSGALVDTARYGLAHETTVPEALTQGADLVCFSGDKLLGGPQAGIVVGSAELIEKIRRHPLYRALRADKLALSVLAKTLELYLSGRWEEEIPVYQMLARTATQLDFQARAWQADLGAGRVIDGFSTIGGGSLPGETLPTRLLAVRVKSPQQFLARLRKQAFPIIARVEDDQVVLDPRTVLPGQEAALLTGLRLALGEYKEIK